MNMINPPYYAVIFTSLKTMQSNDYDEMAEAMVELVKQQKGFLGFDSYRNPDGNGVTISYWETQEDILAWKTNPAHWEAQKQGKENWYENYKIRICKVEREYGIKRQKQTDEN